MKILIKKARVVNPADNFDQVSDLLIEKGKIVRIAKEIKADAGKIILATDKILMPAIVDMHVHLREPGREDKETIRTGTEAALKGGATSLLAMPNTTVAIDSVQNIRLLKEIIKKSAQNNVFIAATITRGRLGRELSDIASLRKEGAIAITDDGASVDDQDVMLKALQEARDEKILVICHCEDKALSANGVVNRGIISTRLGLRSIPKESECQRLRRDIQLAEKTNAAIHIAHVSCRESVELIAQAKKKGIKVTSESAPHYFALSEDALIDYDTNLKVNPPLRNKDDVQAIKQGLKDGTIDAIASDHAPHTENEKEIEFEHAEFGTIGLETILATSITELVEPGVLDWLGLVKKLAYNPARILGIKEGVLSIGSAANLIVLDPHKEWVVEKKDFLSKSKNSCFIGRKLKGEVIYTFFKGKLVYEQGRKNEVYSYQRAGQTGKMAENLRL